MSQEYDRSVELAELVRAAQAGDLVDALLPGASQRVCPSAYPFCVRASDIGVEWHGEFVELLGCGVYRDDVVRLLGGDPTRHAALGLGLGLERLASLHYGVPDIRPLDSMRV